MGDGRLHTPTPDCFLDGITRRTVIDLARARGIEVVERAILPDELAEAREVFLTGTAAEVTPVGEIDHYRFTPGEVDAHPDPRLRADHRADSAGSGNGGSLKPPAVPPVEILEGCQESGRRVRSAGGRCGSRS